MKLLFGLLLGTCLPIFVSTAPNMRGSASTEPGRGTLRLTTSVTDRTSCSPDHFAMTLRLKIQNVGERSVILHKNAAVSRIMVSANQADAERKRYKEVLRYDDPGSHIGFEEPQLSDFTILHPNEFLEFTERVSVHLYNASKPSEQFLSEGTYLLQVDVGSWPYIVEPRPFLNRWKDTGYLWADGIISDPMPFTIEKNRPLTKCT